MKESTQKNLKRAASLGMLALGGVVLALAPDVAFAKEIKDVAQKFNEQWQSLVDVLTYGSYTTGAFVFVKGVMGFKEHSENPNSGKLSKHFITLGVATALFALPSVIGLGMDSGGLETRNELKSGVLGQQIK